MSNSARLALGAALVVAMVSVPLPASAAQPGPGPDVVAAQDTWRSAGAAVEAAAGEVAAATQALEQARATAAKVAAAGEAERERLAAARVVLDAARRAVEEIGAQEPALDDARDELDGPLEVPSGGRPRPGEPASAGARDLAERHELLEKLTRSERVDPDRLERLTAATRARDAAAAAYAERHATHATAAAAAEAHDAAAADAEAALAGARQRLDDLEAEHEASLARLRGLGWRAGVPGRHGWVWPTDGAPGSRFGPRRHPISGRQRLHAGVDVPAPTGQPVVAAAAGTVVAAGMRGGYGFTVDIDHGEGRMTRYAHLSYLHVRAGERVEQSQRIGKVGSTGASTGPHLHWEILVHDRARDPLASFPGA